MYIDLTQLEDEELCIEHRYDERFELREPGIRVTSPPRVELRLRRMTKTEIRVQGHLWVSLEAPCDRCLAPVTMAIEAPFDLFYAPIEGLTAEDDVPLAPQDLTYGFYRDNTLEVDVLVREQTILALPFRRLCRHDCKGLCSRCGADLNKVQCPCQEETTAWSALRDLKRPVQ